MAGYLADGALYKQRSPTGPDLKPALICTSCMRGEPAGSLQIRPESRACTTRMPGGRWYGLPTIQRTKQITPGLPTDSATPLHRYTATPLHRYTATPLPTATPLHRYIATPLHRCCCCYCYCHCLLQLQLLLLILLLFLPVLLLLLLLLCYCCCYWSCYTATVDCYRY